MFDYVYLFVCYINLLFTSGHVTINSKYLTEYPQMNDDRDFVTGGRYKKIRGVLLYALFGGFPVLFIFFLFIIATTFHGTGMTDLLSVVYLFFAFYYILYFRRFYMKNAAMMTALRKYNLWVLMSILIF